MGLQWKQFFYVPQFVDYARVVFLVLAMQAADAGEPWKFPLYYTVSYLLDAFDGMAARYFDQCSHLGYYLDMLIDRASSVACLHYAAKAVAAGTTVVPPGSEAAVVAVLYFCAVMVELVSHGVVVFMSEVLGVHQKKMGHAFAIVRLYLDNKTALFAGCGMYELLGMGLICNWSWAVYISIPFFIFRSLANLVRLFAAVLVMFEGTAQEAKPDPLAEDGPPKSLADSFHRSFGAPPLDPSKLQKKDA